MSVRPAVPLDLEESLSGSVAKTFNSDSSYIPDSFSSLKSSCGSPVIRSLDGATVSPDAKGEYKLRFSMWTGAELALVAFGQRCV
jgi:hypothetical protein